MAFKAYTSERDEVAYLVAAPEASTPTPLIQLQRGICCKGQKSPRTIRDLCAVYQKHSRSI